ncbi:hypothetical protein NC796_08650 [Aliifodinibius sp. S!AR15-10]|uniref:hypothetical protein n=1 Tax=Aliifodinibius sp. S!AR15-10 TaxID=2950437 RepID=UPI002866A142|nr:hypothetical protein [Aliifodinibius sp. S!AR15-10]MDR8391204.1 hypothetical protein [Aliifodinibius sp. S!AR15-10]
MTNKYVNRSKISEAKFREIVRLFAMDLTAIQIAKLAGLNRNTVNRYLKGIRQRIAEFCTVTEPLVLSDRETENGVAAKQKLVGLREKDKRVYTDMLTLPELQEIPTHQHRNSNKSYRPELAIDSFEMVINPENKHRVYLCDQEHHQNNAVKYRCMEGFWGFAQSRLEKFKGLHQSTYRLHLKECEFRYNNEKDQLYPITLKIIRNKPLF